MTLAHTTTPVKGEVERFNNGCDLVEAEYLLHDDNHEGEKGMISRENRRRYAWETSAKALTVLNIFLLIVLVSLWGVSSVRMQQKCVSDTELSAPPYCMYIQFCCFFFFLFFFSPSFPNLEHVSWYILLLLPYQPPYEKMATSDMWTGASPRRGYSSPKHLTRSKRHGIRRWDVGLPLPFPFLFFSFLPFLRQL